MQERDVTNSLSSIERSASRESLALTSTEGTPLLPEESLSILDECAIAEPTHSFWYYTGKAVFSLAVGGFSIPYFVASGIQVNTGNPVVDSIATPCVAIMNTILGIYCGSVAWDNFNDLYHSRESVCSRVTKFIGATTLSIIPMLPPISGAITISKTAAEAGGLTVSVIGSMYPFYFFIAYRLIDSGILSLIQNLKLVCCRTKFPGYQTLRYKREIHHLLISASTSLSNKIEVNSTEVSLQMNSSNAISKYILLIDIGYEWEQQSSELSCGDYFLRGLQFFLSVLVGIFVASAWVSYDCSLAAFFATSSTPLNWTLSTTAMIPIYYVSFMLGFQGFMQSTGLLKGLVCFDHRDIPISMRYRAAIVLPMGIGLLFIAAFSWADADVLLQITCPAGVQVVMHHLIKPALGTFNGLLAIEFIDAIGKFTIEHWGKQKNRFKVVKVAERYAQVIGNMSIEKFSKVMQNCRPQLEAGLFSRSNRLRHVADDANQECKSFNVMVY